MHPKSTEKTLIDLYRFKKYDYFEVKTYIEKWIDHFNVAGRYDYRINKERETLPDILEKSLLNGCIPKADRVSAKQIIHIPDIYMKFGATPEECLKFKIIDNIDPARQNEILKYIENAKLEADEILKEIKKFLK